MKGEVGMYMYACVLEASGCNGKRVLLVGIYVGGKGLGGGQGGRTLFCNHVNFPVSWQFF